MVRELTERGVNYCLRNLEAIKGDLEQGETDLITLPRNDHRSVTGDCG